MEQQSKDKWQEILRQEKERIMKVGKYVEELSEWIEDDYCYSEAAAEIVDEYCRELQKEPGMTIPVEEWEDAIDESWDWVWADKAQRLIEAEITKWHTIGLKYWEDGDIDIHQHLTQYREL